jgi:hypothetical protein
MAEFQVNSDLEQQGEVQYGGSMSMNYGTARMSQMLGGLLVQFSALSLCFSSSKTGEKKLEKKKRKTEKWLSTK